MSKSKRPITVEDLWKLDRVGAVSISPDGAQAVCAVTRYDMAENKGATSLWLLSSFGGEPRRLTTGGEKDGQPKWSPAGDVIAFVGQREQEGRKDETPQIYAIAPDGGEARRLTDFAPGVTAFKWFPDGRRIAFIAWVWPELKGSKAQAKRYQEFKARKESAYVTSEAQYRYWDHHLPMGRVVHLHVLDIATGRITDLLEGTDIELPRGDPGADLFDISPDGKRIVFAHDASARQQLDHCKTLSEVDVKRRRVRTVLHDAQWDFDAPRYSPDGTQLAFLASEQGRRHTLPTQMAVLDSTGPWRLLSGQWDRAVDAPLRWLEDGSAILFGAEDQGQRHVWQWTLGESAPSVKARGGWVQGFDCAAGVLVSAADAMDHPVRVFARHGDAPPVRLDRFNDERLSKLQLSRYEAVTVTGAQGDAVQVWLVYPPSFPAKADRKAARQTKWPVMHNIHGGPHAAAGDTWHYRWNTQVFAAQGYVVAAVNYHGSSGFGHAFLDSITHRWGELEMQDVEAATDWLLKQPWADPKRVFATGGSYGGFMVAWMNGHVAPGRYQAYVCHAGCFDWTAMFADDAYTWHAKEVGGWYWDDLARVHAQSPHAFAAQMQTPTLVIHGALDYRVPDAQGLAYYNTLQAKGVDARLVWFPDENHWILKPRNSKLWYAEFFAWLKRYGGV